MVLIIFETLFFLILNSPTLVWGIPGGYPTVKLRRAAYIVREHYATGKITS